jgi:hypothetical protein
MAEETYYVAVAFVATDRRIVVPAEQVECLNPNAAVMRAEALSQKPGYVGALAFSRSLDPSSGGLSDVKVIRKFGDVPDDLSGL